MSGLTFLENAVYNAITALHDEDISYGPTLQELVDYFDMDYLPDLNEKNLRGVISSLSKKNFISIDADIGVPTCYTSIELAE